MRIFGLGTDIVNTSLFQSFKALSQEPNGIVRNFTQSEIDYCESKAYHDQHYAARFAAKEATLKALGRGLSSGMKNIEVGKLSTGAPAIVLHGKLAEEFDYLRFMVSISHCSAYATATVIAIIKE